MRRIKGKLIDADRSGALILLAHNPKVAGSTVAAINAFRNWRSPVSGDLSLYASLQCCGQISLQPVREPSSRRRLGWPRVVSDFNWTPRSRASCATNTPVSTAPSAMMASMRLRMEATRLDVDRRCRRHQWVWQSALQRQRR